MNDRLKIKYIGESDMFFENGKVYEAFWDGDGYHEPLTLLTTDEYSVMPHIVAQHSLDDEWFQAHFEVID